jgi:hypothetical protein
MLQLELLFGMIILLTNFALLQTIENNSHFETKILAANSKLALPPITF